MKIPSWIRNVFKPPLLLTGDLTEILFESRNKEYGAYSLRNHYIRNKLIGMVSAYLLFLICMLGPSLKCNKEQTPLAYMTEVRLEAPPEFVLPKLPKQTKPVSPANEDNPIKKKKQVSDRKVVDDKVEEPIQPEEVKFKDPNKSDSADQTMIHNSDRPGSMEEGDWAVDFADVMPQYPGGNHALSWFIHSKLIYPKEAVSLRTEGIVVIGFIVDHYGRVRNPHVLKSLTPVCDAEALRVVRQIPDWIPGQNKGRNVSVQFKLPIEFKLAR